MNFEEFKAKVFKVGLLDITMQEDGTWMSFILRDGTSMNIYTQEIEVPVCCGQDYGDVNFEQSEMLFFDGDLS
jgi:hypothetical protein